LVEAFFTSGLKSAAYTAIARPTVEYASTVWDPSNQKKIKSIEQVQKRAATRVFEIFYDCRTRGPTLYQFLLDLLVFCQT
jgi:hypothetical protein